MTTPPVTGLLTWAQPGRYTGFDDRTVITALAAGRTGVVAPVALAGGPGLTIVADHGWMAVVPCGDGTVAVAVGSVAVQVQAAAGGSSGRTDDLRVTAPNPDDAGLWQL